MHKTRTKKMLIFMVAGALGLGSLWVLGNAPLEIATGTPLTKVTLKQLNLGIDQNFTEWKMEGKTLTVKPAGEENDVEKNIVFNGASQVGGIGNKVNGNQEDTGYSSVIVAGTRNTVAGAAKYGAILASEGAQLL